MTLRGTTQAAAARVLSELLAPDAAQELARRIADAVVGDFFIAENEGEDRRADSAKKRRRKDETPDAAPPEAAPVHDNGATTPAPEDAPPPNGGGGLF